MKPKLTRRTGIRHELLAVLSIAFLYAVGCFAQETGGWQASEILRQSSYKGTPDFKRLFFVNEALGWATDLGGGLAKTEDGGRSWKLTPYAEGYAAVDSIHFLHSSRGWVATNQETSQPGSASSVLLESSDGGQQWRLWSSLEALKVRALLDMRFSTNGSAVAVGFIMPGLRSVVLHSGDLGKTWNIVATPRSLLYRLAVGPRGVLWASGDGGTVLRSEDEGQTWSQVHTRIDMPDGFRGIDAPGEGMAVAVSDFGGVIIRTVDGGRNWDRITPPAPYEDLSLSAVRFSNSESGWAVGEKGVILSTNDGGKSWKFEAQMGAGYLRDIAIVGNRLVAAGDDGSIFWRDRPSNRQQN